MSIIPSVQPFHAMAYPIDPPLALDISRNYAEHCSMVAARYSLPPFYFPAPLPVKAKGGSGRLRVGYVSSDFGNHPLSHLMGSVFGMHNRKNVEVFCFALSPSDDSEWRLRTEAEAEHFVDVSSMSSDMIANLVIQNGGSFMNYYMFHGGTNFGTTAGRFVATSYDYDAPLDEYGLQREPKYTHLKYLHRAIKMSEPALVSSDPKVTKLGSNQEAHVYSSNSGACAAFLANYDPKWSVKVTFGGSQYDLPAWSISILPDCKKEVYNTAKVIATSIHLKMTPVMSFSWQSYIDQTPSADEGSAFSSKRLLEQLNVTRDASDYLWYMTDVNIAANEGFLRTGNHPVLTVMSAGHALYVFVNNQLAGTAYGSLERPQLTFSSQVNLRAGVNRISLLSAVVGLANVGTHFETWNEGVLGPVNLKGLNEGTRDLTWQTWSYKIGMKGENLGLDTISGSSSVEWVEGSLIAQRQPLSWYKTTFNAPAGNDPLALDMNTMSKGQMWINGQSIGRHWPANKASGSCGQCSYAGSYSETKCLANCGQASQRWYHVPRSWLKPSGNLLVVFEEWGGNPRGIQLVKRTLS